VKISTSCVWLYSTHLYERNVTSTHTHPMLSSSGCPTKLYCHFLISPPTQKCY